MYKIYIYMYLYTKPYTVQNIHNGYFGPTCRPKERSSWERHWPGGSGPHRLRNVGWNLKWLQQKNKTITEHMYGNNDELCCKSIDVCTFVYIYVYIYTCTYIDWLLEGMFLKKPTLSTKLRSIAQWRAETSTPCSYLNDFHGWSWPKLMLLTSQADEPDTLCRCSLCVMPVLFFPFTEKKPVELTVQLIMTLCFPPKSPSGVVDSRKVPLSRMLLILQSVGNDIFWLQAPVENGSMAMVVFRHVILLRRLRHVATWQCHDMVVLYKY